MWPEDHTCLAYVVCQNQKKISVTTTTTANPDILTPAVIRRIAIILAGLPVGEAVSPREVPAEVSMWSPTIWAVLGGAVTAMAVVGMMMSGASSVASEGSENRRHRYANARSIEEVSDPEERMTIHGGGPDEDDMNEEAGIHEREPEAEPAGEEGRMDQALRQQDLFDLHSDHG